MSNRDNGLLVQFIQHPSHNGYKKVWGSKCKTPASVPLSLHNWEQIFMLRKQSWSLIGTGAEADH